VAAGGVAALKGEATLAGVRKEPSEKYGLAFELAAESETAAAPVEGGGGGVRDSNASSATYKAAQRPSALFASLNSPRGLFAGSPGANKRMLIRLETEAEQERWLDELSMHM